MVLEENKTEYWSETFTGADFSGLEIASREFEGCIFRDCNFSEVTFNRCNFVDCEFTKCNLGLATIQYSKFSAVEFVESKLIGINWANIELSKFAFNTPIKFYKCVINDSSFFGLNLHELVLEECKAHGVDFREGDFSRANFTHTDFTGCLFGSTNLTEADFSEATDYDIDVLNNIITQAKFSRFEAVRLLESLDIELID